MVTAEAGALQTICAHSDLEATSAVNADRGDTFALTAKDLVHLLHPSLSD